MSIAIRPDNDAGRLLALLVDRPGQLSAEALGERLWRPAVTPGNVLAVRRAVLTKTPPPPSPWRRRPPTVAPTRFPALEGRTWTADAGRILGRLVEAGLVERMRPPRLSEDWEMEMAVLVEDEGGDSEEEGQDTEPAEERDEEERVDLSIAHQLVARLRVEPLPQSFAEWATDTPGGQVLRAVARLYKAGIVVPPSHRWPTEAGIAMVLGWREGAGLATTPRRAAGWLQRMAS